MASRSFIFGGTVLKENKMYATFSRLTLAAMALSALMMTGAPALAEMVSYKADLKAATEVPPNDSKGTGAVDAKYDTTSKKFSWTITYSGLTGPATAAHFHGPAAAGANAPPVAPLSGNLASPIRGDTTLTDLQAADLQAGRWYFNVHTAAHKDGELRGQVVKGSSAMAPLSSPSATVPPVPGANSFTEGEARSRIEASGYTNVTDLKKDSQSIWRGKAMKDGKSVGVSLDFQGHVVAQ
jgi:CHRD domain